jgi:pimeloyl-ACP methyl ester carboxylesterase
MSTSPAIDSYTAVTVPTQFVEANGIRFAYRHWGRQACIPLVFNQHFSGNLDNWDPAVLDGLAKDREVVIFNNAGVASSTGEVPSTFAGMARNAEAFIDALGLKQIDLLGFSIGGMVAQQIVIDRPELIRKLILSEVEGSASFNFCAKSGKPRASTSPCDEEQPGLPLQVAPAVNPPTCEPAKWLISPRESWRKDGEGPTLKQFCTQGADAGSTVSQKTERAARQQGSSFLRENSSNGGKTIRTFWLHSRSDGRECQG